MTDVNAKRILLITIIINFFTFNMDAYDDSWVPVNGTIVADDIETSSIPENTLIDVLIKESGTSRTELWDQSINGIKIFIITYEAPLKINNVEKKQIVELSGLFNLLHDDLKNILASGKKFTVPLYYDPSNPVSVAIGLEGKIYSFPPLLTNKIDDFWEKK